MRQSEPNCGVRSSLGSNIARMNGGSARSFWQQEFGLSPVSTADTIVAGQAGYGLAEQQDPFDMCRSEQVDDAVEVTGQLTVGRA